ncbi:MAG: glycosyltransferase [Alphaproteobacteria bacterium]
MTVGAYDLPFDRLVRATDQLAADDAIPDPIFAQIGHSCEPSEPYAYERFLPLTEMERHADKARIILTQGGPGSIMLALTRGKVPIVVPRQHAEGEMVDNHQVTFARKLAEEERILLVMDVAELPELVRNYDDRVAGLKTAQMDPQEKADAFAKRLEAKILAL